MTHDEQAFDREFVRQRLYVADDDLAVRRCVHQRYSEKHPDLQHTMPQYHQLWEEAARHASCAVAAKAASWRFCIENGPAYLEHHFRHVHLLEDALAFPTAEPLLDYFASARWMKLGPEHGQAEWEAVCAFARRAVEVEIARCGDFRVDKITGVIVAQSSFG